MGQDEKSGEVSEYGIGHDQIPAVSHGIF